MYLLVNMGKWLLSGAKTKSAVTVEDIYAEGTSSPETTTRMLNLRLIQNKKITLSGLLEEESMAGKIKEKKPIKFVEKVVRLTIYKTL
jgi:hypothetical protein